MLAGRLLWKTLGFHSNCRLSRLGAKWFVTLLLRKPITAPVGRSVGRAASRQFQNARFGLRRAPSVLGAAVPRIQTDQSLLLKALLPKTDVTISASEPLTNFTVRPTSC